MARGPAARELLSVHRPIQVLDSIALILPLRTGLATAKRCLTSRLSRSQDFAAIEGLAPQLPDVMSAMGFEIRLAEADPRIDFGTVIYAEDAGRKLLRDSIERAPSNNAGSVLPANWKQISGFLRRWCDPASSLHNGITRLFFEFDMLNATSDPPIPCLFATLDETVWSCAQNPSSIVPLADEVLKFLVGVERAEQDSRPIRLCVEKLPTGSLLLHVGAMLARPDCPIRLCGWMPPDALPHYLETIRAPIDPQPVTEFCGLQPSAITFQLTLVGGEIAPRLDIEWHFRRQPHAEFRWERLLRALVERNLCAPQRLQTVLDWPGLVLETKGSATGQLLVRGVSHVKVSLKSASEAAGKAYLTLAPARSFQALTQGEAQ